MLNDLHKKNKQSINNRLDDIEEALTTFKNIGDVDEKFNTLESDLKELIESVSADIYDKLAKIYDDVRLDNIESVLGILRTKSNSDGIMYNITRFDRIEQRLDDIEQRLESGGI